ERVRRRMPSSDDESPPPGELLAISADDVRQRRGDEPAATGFGLTGSLESRLPERVRALPGSGGIDDGPGTEISQRSVGVLGADEEGSRLSLRCSGAVLAVSGHCHNSGIGLDSVPELGSLRKGFEVV